MSSLSSEVTVNTPIPSQWLTSVVLIASLTIVGCQERAPSPQVPAPTVAPASVPAVPAAGEPVGGQFYRVFSPLHRKGMKWVYEFTASDPAQSLSLHEITHKVTDVQGELITIRTTTDGRSSTATLSSTDNPMKRSGTTQVGNTIISFQSEGAEDVQVAAGAFKGAAKIGARIGAEMTMTGWFSPDVGLIKSVSRMHLNGETITLAMELKSYTSGEGAANVSSPPPPPSAFPNGARLTSAGQELLTRGRFLVEDRFVDTEVISILNAGLFIPTAPEPPQYPYYTVELMIAGVQKTGTGFVVDPAKARLRDFSIKQHESDTGSRRDYPLQYTYLSEGVKGGGGAEFKITDTTGRLAGYVSATLAGGYDPVTGQVIASRAFKFEFDIVENLVHR